MTAVETVIRLIKLTPGEREKLGRVLATGKPAVTGDGTCFLIDVGSGDAGQVGAALAAFVAAAQVIRADQSDTFALLISAMTPSRSAGRGVAVQAQRNAAARAALEEEFGLLTTTEVSRAAGGRAAHTSSLPSRWRGEGRIFGVHGGDGGYLYPAFQFEPSGRPLPIIAEVIRELATVMDGWSLALWFVGSNGWLGGRRPVDVLGDERVIAAARELTAGGGV